LIWYLRNDHASESPTSLHVFESRSDGLAAADAAPTIGWAFVAISSPASVENAVWANWQNGEIEVGSKLLRGGLRVHAAVVFRVRWGCGRLGRGSGRTVCEKPSVYSNIAIASCGIFTKCGCFQTSEQLLPVHQWSCQDYPLDLHWLSSPVGSVAFERR
jgi:hypothetical protein